MRTYKVGYFVGSLSSSSINRVLSRALIRFADGDLPALEPRQAHVRQTPCRPARFRACARPQNRAHSA